MEETEFSLKADTNSTPPFPPNINDASKSFSKKQEWITLIIIYFSNIAVNCAAGALAPSLTYFQEKFETSAATISGIFTVKIISYMLGGLSFSFIFDRVNRQLMIIFILLLYSISMFILPFCTSVSIYFACGFVIGLSISWYDTAVFVWIPEMMGKDNCPPFIQANSFFFAIGTNLASLLLAPFLKDTFQLVIPFSVIGALLIAGALGQLILYLMWPYQTPAEDNYEEDKLSEEELKRKWWSFAKIRLVFLALSLYAVYRSMHRSMFSFLPKFAQSSEIGMSQSEAAYLQSAMSAAYLVGRGIGMFAVVKISSLFLIIINLFAIFIANILLTWWPHRMLLLWISSIIFGIGFSSTIASITGYIQKYLKITNFIGTLSTVSSASLSALYPLIIGGYIESYPGILSLINFSGVVIMFAILGMIMFITKNNKTRY